MPTFSPKKQSLDPYSPPRTTYTPNDHRGSGWDGPWFQDHIPNEQVGLHTTLMEVDGMGMLRQEDHFPVPRGGHPVPGKSREILRLSDRLCFALISDDASTELSPVSSTLPTMSENKRYTYRYTVDGSKPLKPIKIETVGCIM